MSDPEKSSIGLNDCQGPEKNKLSKRTTKPTKQLVRPAKTQISLRIHAVWSELSLIASAFYSLQAIHTVMNEKPCHIGCLYKLIFDGYKSLIVGFGVRWINYIISYILAHRIRKSGILPWDRNSYRTQVILSRVGQKSRISTCLICSGWNGRHERHR